MTDGVKIISDVMIKMKKNNSISVTLKDLLGIIKTVIKIFHRRNVSIAMGKSRDFRFRR